ncbi:MAG: ABC transporter permease subunit [Chloroflexi bacterium]|nr:ABC transporter permease subunit [Chloroflexota bacterium]
MVVALRWALPQVELQPAAAGLRFARLLVVFAVVLLLIFGLFELAGLMSILGARIAAGLGSWGFLGTLLFQGGDILRLIIPLLGSLAAGGAVASFLGRIGQRMAENLSTAVARAINLLLAAMAGATLFVLGGALLEWFYQWGRPELTVYWPAAIGGGLGLLAATLASPKAVLPIGMVIYYVTRTILNALRSVEALVMAIVFVISVGIGPFAGVLALGLHTIVSLGKLYSEQVESIMAGPLEAVQATGANRLQTIVYAVIPQIIPPFISYTMYRWDINVRMSTIIGFVGGGGIGFLLLQNINLLNYRAAATQMFAIAVVVAMMDYVSSVLRERYV